MDAPADVSLTDTVYARLEADTSLSEEAQFLVLAAVEGDDDLTGTSRDLPAPGRSPSPSPVRAYLSSIRVRGFRGVGPEVDLGLVPAPGLTVISGRNGCGKSSFAEALEVALTRNSYRWTTRSSVWCESWRNLHLPDPASITVQLVEEGKGQLTVGVDWPGGASLNDGSWWTQRRPNRRRPGLDALAWSRDLDTFRPFLSYDELGALFEVPSKLHDALSSILGLDQLKDAQMRLADEEKSLGRAAAEAKAIAQGLKRTLPSSADERAATALELIGRRKPDLDAVRRLVVGLEQPDPDGQLATLRSLTQMSAPDPEHFEALRDAYLRATADLGRAVEAGAAADQRKRDLLGLALDLHRDGDRDCPVCSVGRLDAEWAERVRVELEKDRERADALAAVRDHRRATAAELVSVIGPPPLVLRSVDDALVPGVPQLRTAWENWAALRSDAGAAAADGLDLLLGLHAAVDVVLRAVRADLDRRDDAWKPLAFQCGEWLRQAELAAKDSDRLAAVKAANKWVKTNALDLRNERLRPLAERARRIWSLLRQESNVDLGGITLAGSATQRRVQLDALVDGAEAGALGVMSQGELHALALALFLPRATAGGSPFGFVVIDDPVQAMDPSKVDGLARVLDETARDRQVIVFTHDDRLPEAVRRLEIQARHVEVSRTERSAVAVTPGTDPARRYLDDAAAIAKDVNVPDDIRRRVIPELCRLAVEATCRERYFSHQLAAGTSRSDVETTWRDAPRTRVRVALARGVEQPESDRWLNDKPARRTAMDVCTRDVHGGLSRDPQTAVSSVRALVTELSVRLGS